MKLEVWKKADPYMKLFVGNKQDWNCLRRGKNQFGHEVSLELCYDFREDSTIDIIKQYLDPETPDGLFKSSSFEDPERTLAMIHDYFFDNMTMGQMAEKYNLTPERIRQLLGLCGHRTRRYVSQHYEIKDTDNILQLPISNMRISIRSYNALRRAGYETVEDITVRTKEELLKVRNLGKGCADEIEQWLSRHNLCLMEG